MGGYGWQWHATWQRSGSCLQLCWLHKPDKVKECLAVLTVLNTERSTVCPPVVLRLIAEKCFIESGGHASRKVRCLEITAASCDLDVLTPPSPCFASIFWIRSGDLRGREFKGWRNPHPFSRGGGPLYVTYIFSISGVKNVILHFWHRTSKYKPCIFRCYERNCNITFPR